MDCDSSSLLLFSPSPLSHGILDENKNREFVMVLKIPVLLCCTLLASMSLARRGGGRSGGSGSSSGSDSSSGSSGGSGGYSYLPQGSDDAVKAQQTDLYLMSATYYNGSITITHRLFNTSNDNAGCWNNNLWEKTYTYDGVLAIGPKRSINDTNPLYFSLRGFDPTATEILGTKQEFLRLTSTTLGELEEQKRDKRFGGIPAAPGMNTEEFKVLWNVSLAQNATTVDDKGTTLIDSWDLSANYIHKPLPRQEILTPKRIFKYSTSFVTLPDICVSGYELVSETEPKSPYGSPASGSSVGIMYPDLGARIDIQGVGTDRVFFSMDNSTFGQQPLGVSAPAIRKYTPEKPWEHVAPWQNIRSLDFYEDMLNASAVVSIRFEGVKYGEKSSEMQNVTSVEALAWVGAGNALRSGVSVIVLVAGSVAGFLVLT